jgi:hypothetical protein
MMLRSERSGLTMAAAQHNLRGSANRQLLLAVAPPPRAPAFALSGWPEWLTPVYRAGGHRPNVRLLEEDA